MNRGRPTGGLRVAYALSFTAGAVAALASPSAISGQREFLEARWELIWATSSDFETADLLAPALLAHDGNGGLVTYDYGQRALKRVGNDGETKWAVGRSGQGPGEFVRPTGISVVGDRILVTDPDNNRLNTIGLDGEWLGEARVEGVTRLAQFPDGRSVALNVATGDLLRVFDPSGEELLSASYTGFDVDLTALPREGLITGGQRASTMLVGFLHSGDYAFVRSDGDSITLRHVRGVESFDFAQLVSWKSGRSDATIFRLDPTVPDGTNSLDHDEMYFYAFFSGATDDAGRVVDLYTVDAAKYVGSLLLPSEIAFGAVLKNGIIAGLVFDPLPHIKAWRWSQGPRATEFTKDESR